MPEHQLNANPSRLLVMKRELALLFQKYGQLLDVSIKRNLKMRGQAFVVFKDMEAAEKALNALQGQFFFNKPMVCGICIEDVGRVLKEGVPWQDIQYARYKSDAVAREDGTLEQNKEARAERKGWYLGCLSLFIVNGRFAANAPPSDEEEEDDKEGSDEEGQDGEEGERPAKRAKKEEEVAPAAPPGMLNRMEGSPNFVHRLVSRHSLQAFAACLPISRGTTAQHFVCAKYSGRDR